MEKKKTNRNQILVTYLIMIFFIATNDNNIFLDKCYPFAGKGGGGVHSMQGVYADFGILINMWNGFCLPNMITISRAILFYIKKYNKMRCWILKKKSTSSLFEEQKEMSPWRSCVRQHLSGAGSSPAGSVGRDLNLQKLNYQHLTATSVAVVLVVR